MRRAAAGPPAKAAASWSPISPPPAPLAAVLANGAGLGAHPLSPAILAFAALLTMTMFEVTGSLAAAGPGRGPGPRRVAAAQ